MSPVFYHLHALFAPIGVSAIMLLCACFQIAVSFLEATIFSLIAQLLSSNVYCIFVEKKIAKSYVFA